MAVGCIEPQFYKLFLKGLGLSTKTDLPDQMDQESWPELKALFASVFQTKNQAEWCAVFDNTDACVTPVVELEEPYENAASHGASRKILTKSDEGGIVPNPAPRLSRTSAEPVEHRKQPKVGEHTVQILTECGVSNSTILELIKEGVISDTSAMSKL